MLTLPLSTQTNTTVNTIEANSYFVSLPEVENVKEDKITSTRANPTIFSFPLDNKVKKIDALQLKILQNELDQKQIGLDCLNVPSIKNKNYFIQQNIDAYLDFIKDQTLGNGKSWYEIKKKMFEKCSTISFDQLESGLSLSVHKNSMNF